MSALAAAAIAAPVAGGVAQYITAQQAQKAAAEQQAKIQAALDKVQDPQFDMSQFTPEEYQLVGKYAPEMLPIVQERAPQLMQLSGAGQQGQDATLSALQRLTSIGNSGADAQSQGLIEQAQRQSQIQNQGQQASILDSMSRRGAQAGSGLGFAAALNAQQGANQSASQGGANAAMQAYQQRLQALTQAGNFGQQVQANDMNMQGQNAGIINGFNQRMSAMQNQNNQYNTGNLNEAQRTNLGAQQNTADQNVGLRNNAVAQKNTMAQQEYQNALDKVRIQAGVSNNAAQNALTSGQNQNNAVQGMTGGISSGLLYADGQDEKKKQQQGGLYAG